MLQFLKYLIDTKKYQNYGVTFDFEDDELVITLVNEDTGVYVKKRWFAFYGYITEIDLIVIVDNLYEELKAKESEDNDRD